MAERHGAYEASAGRHMPGESSSSLATRSAGSPHQSASQSRSQAAATQEESSAAAPAQLPLPVQPPPAQPQPQALAPVAAAAPSGGARPGLTGGSGPPSQSQVHGSTAGLQITGREPDWGRVASVHEYYSQQYGLFTIMFCYEDSGPTAATFPGGPAGLQSGRAWLEKHKHLLPARCQQQKSHLRLTPAVGAGRASAPPVPSAAPGQAPAARPGQAEAAVAAALQQQQQQQQQQEGGPGHQARLQQQGTPGPVLPAEQQRLQDQGQETPQQAASGQDGGSVALGLKARAAEPTTAGDGQAEAQRSAGLPVQGRQVLLPTLSNGSAPQSRQGGERGQRSTEAQQHAAQQRAQQARLQPRPPPPSNVAQFPNSVLTLQQAQHAQQTQQQQAQQALQQQLAQQQQVQQLEAALARQQAAPGAPMPQQLPPRPPVQAGALRVQPPANLIGPFPSGSPGSVGLEAGLLHSLHQLGAQQQAQQGEQAPAAKRRRLAALPTPPTQQQQQAGQGQGQRLGEDGSPAQLLLQLLQPAHVDQLDMPSVAAPRPDIGQAPPASAISADLEQEAAEAMMEIASSAGVRPPPAQPPGSSGSAVRASTSGGGGAGAQQAAGSTAAAGAASAGGLQLRTQRHFWLEHPEGSGQWTIVLSKSNFPARIVLPIRNPADMARALFGSEYVGAVEGMGEELTSKSREAVLVDGLREETVLFAIFHNTNGRPRYLQRVSDLFRRHSLALGDVLHFRQLGPGRAGVTVLKAGTQGAEAIKAMVGFDDAVEAAKVVQRRPKRAAPPLPLPQRQSKPPPPQHQQQEDAGMLAPLAKFPRLVSQPALPRQEQQQQQQPSWAPGVVPSAGRAPAEPAAAAAEPASEGGAGGAGAAATPGSSAPAAAPAAQPAPRHQQLEQEAVEEGLPGAAKRRFVVGEGLPLLRADSQGAGSANLPLPSTAAAGGEAGTSGAARGPGKPGIAALGQSAAAEAAQTPEGHAGLAPSMATEQRQQQQQQRLAHAAVPAPDVSLPAGATAAAAAPAGVMQAGAGGASVPVGQGGAVVAGDAAASAAPGPAETAGGREVVVQLVQPAVLAALMQQQQGQREQQRPQLAAMPGTSQPRASLQQQQQQRQQVLGGLMEGMRLRLAGQQAQQGGHGPSALARVPMVVSQPMPGPPARPMPAATAGAALARLQQFRPSRAPPAAPSTAQAQAQAAAVAQAQLRQAAAAQAHVQTQAQAATAAKVRMQQAVAACLQMQMAGRPGAPFGAALPGMGMPGMQPMLIKSTPVNVPTQLTPAGGAAAPANQAQAAQRKEQALQQPQLKEQQAQQAAGASSLALPAQPAAVPVLHIQAQEQQLQQHPPPPSPQQQLEQEQQVQGRPLQPAGAQHGQHQQSMAATAADTALQSSSTDRTSPVAACSPPALGASHPNNQASPPLSPPTAPAQAPPPFLPTTAPAPASLPPSSPAQAGATLPGLTPPQAEPAGPQSLMEQNVQVPSHTRSPQPPPLQVSATVAGLEAQQQPLPQPLPNAKAVPAVASLQQGQPDPQGLSGLQVDLRVRAMLGALGPAVEQFTQRAMAGLERQPLSARQGLMHTLEFLLRVLTAPPSEQQQAPAPASMRLSGRNAGAAPSKGRGP